MIDEKRLAEIREMLGPRTVDESRGAFPIEDAADDLLAMLDEVRSDLDAAIARGVDEAMRENDEALDAVRAKMRLAEVHAGALFRRAEDAERKLAAAREAWSRVDIGDLAAGIYASTGSGDAGKRRLREAEASIDAMEEALK